jgi:hypothetical protein
MIQTELSDEQLMSHLCVGSSGAEEEVLARLCMI